MLDRKKVLIDQGLYKGTQPTMEDTKLNTASNNTSKTEKTGNSTTVFTQPEQRRIVKAKRNYKGGGTSSMMNLVKTDNNQSQQTANKTNKAMFFGQMKKAASMKQVH